MRWEPVPAQELLPLLEHNLSARAQPQRAAALKVLSGFQQPALPAAGSEQALAAAREPSDIFPRWAHIESQVPLELPPTSASTPTKHKTTLLLLQCIGSAAS